MAVATPTKRCPGFEPTAGALTAATASDEYRQAPHEAPLSEFGKSGDKLSTRCKPCGNAYGKAWALAKKAGVQFSVRKPAADQQPGVAQAATEAERAERAAVSPLRQPEPAAPRYADPLAEQASKGQAPGYTTEVVDGTIYALPDGEAVNTTEGQAALGAVNAARTERRRRLDRERKRAERAASKSKEGATA